LKQIYHKIPSQTGD